MQPSVLEGLLDIFYNEEPGYEGQNTYLLRWVGGRAGDGMLLLPGCDCWVTPPPKTTPHPYLTHALTPKSPVCSKDKRSLMLGWILVLAVKVEQGAVLEPEQLQVGGRLAGRRERGCCLGYWWAAWVRTVYVHICYISVCIFIHIHVYIYEAFLFVLTVQHRDRVMATIALALRSWLPLCLCPSLHSHTHPPIYPFAGTCR